jgi:glycosyltransferase involved in cell wall biosynthesis
MAPKSKFVDDSSGAVLAESMKKSGVIVGYTQNNYPNAKNIINLFKDVRYYQVNDSFKFGKLAVSSLNTILGRELLPTLDLSNQFNDFDLNSVSILHFINAVSYGTTPWITTFETILPRFKSVLDYPLTLSHPLPANKVNAALEALAGPSCRQCIAMSNCAANIQRVFLAQFPEYQPEIESKLIVLHPPQPLLISQYSDKPISLDHALKFIMVGAAFFRKGGIEIIETFDMLRQKFRYEIELTIVSSFTIDAYATGETVSDVKRVQEFVKQHQDWIYYYPKLDNQRVLELMRQSHVGLLPSYAETYGFSVLELQATGCPVITTDVRAFPEINHQDWGWLISIPKNALGEAMYQTSQGRQTISKFIRQGLEAIVHEIFANRTVIAKKAEKAINRIQSDHSPVQYAERIREIYFRAITA